jgi:hypothetical protein
MDQPLTYEHRQIAWPLIGLTLAFDVWSMYRAWRSKRGFRRARSLFLSATSLGFMVVFGALTVGVSGESVRWRFGIFMKGPGGDVPIFDVVSAQRVRTSWWSGWGMRRIRGGNQYNVAGFEAVELELESGRKVRLGTDEPEALLAAVTAAMATAKVA